MKFTTTNVLECVAPKLRRTSTPRVCTFLKKGLLQAARAPLLHNAPAPKHIEEEQPTPLRCFLCVLREQCPLMGLPSSGISSTDGAPLVYVASESTALNTWFQNLESCLGDDFFRFEQYISYCFLFHQWMRDRMHRLEGETRWRDQTEKLD